MSDIADKRAQFEEYKKQMAQEIAEYEAQLANEEKQMPANMPIEKHDINFPLGKFTTPLSLSNTPNFLKPNIPNFYATPQPSQYDNFVTKAQAALEVVKELLVKKQMALTGIAGAFISLMAGMFSMMAGVIVVLGVTGYFAFRLFQATRLENYLRTKYGF